MQYTEEEIRMALMRHNLADHFIEHIIQDIKDTHNNEKVTPPIKRDRPFIDL